MTSHPPASLPLPTANRFYLQRVGPTILGRPLPLCRSQPLTANRCHLFIVRPHPYHLPRLLLCIDLIHQPMLEIDPTRVRAGQIADQ